MISDFLTQYDSVSAALACARCGASVAAGMPHVCHFDLTEAPTTEQGSEAESKGESDDRS